MKMKRMLRNLIIVCAAFAALSVAVQEVWAYLTTPNAHYLARVETQVRRNGVTSDLNEVLAERPVRAGEWAGCVVRVHVEMKQEQNFSFPVQTWDGPVACYPDWRTRVEFAGLQQRLTSSTVQAPDGQSYVVAVWTAETPAWLVPFLLGAAAGLVVAWVALALWIFTDARDRLHKSAAAWLLLGLLTGPVGLAVWLVVRGEPILEHCPGCGADRVPGTTYCVHCGRPLVAATCPGCGKRVEDTWTHCGACGAPLDGKGGGGDGLLADENGA